MKRTKQQYDVYRVTDHYDALTSEISFTRETYIGTTYAVSEAQAINNVRFNSRNTSNPHGGYSVNDDYQIGDSHKVSQYKAVLTN